MTTEPLAGNDLRLVVPRRTTMNHSPSQTSTQTSGGYQMPVEHESGTTAPVTGAQQRTAGVIVCAQDHVLPDECPECGGWLHVTQRAGDPGPGGDYCSENCASDAEDRIAEDHEFAHLKIRDLVCRCGICRSYGRPTGAEITEYNTYLDSRQR